ncbi:MAG: hypothetical protein ACE5EG_01030 [Thermoanaerobaculia bacterium]
MAPLLWFAGAGSHLGHDAGEGGTPIFADASHADQANHWEAASSIDIGRCPACLATTQPAEPAPVDSAEQASIAGGVAAPGDLAALLDPAAGRLRRPRAPPRS